MNKESSSNSLALGDLILYNRLKRMQELEGIATDVISSYDKFFMEYDKLELFMSSKYNDLSYRKSSCRS